MKPKSPKLVLKRHFSFCGIWQSSSGANRQFADCILQSWFVTVICRQFWAENCRSWLPAKIYGIETAKGQIAVYRVIFCWQNGRWIVYVTGKVEPQLTVQPINLWFKQANVLALWIILTSVRKSANICAVFKNWGCQDNLPRQIGWKNCHIWLPEKISGLCRQLAFAVFFNFTAKMASLPTMLPECHIDCSDSPNCYSKEGKILGNYRCDAVLAFAVRCIALGKVFAAALSYERLKLICTSFCRAQTCFRFILLCNFQQAASKFELLDCLTRLQSMGFDAVHFVYDFSEKQLGRMRIRIKAFSVKERHPNQNVFEAIELTTELPRFVVAIQWNKPLKKGNKEFQLCNCLQDAHSKNSKVLFSRF